MPLLFVYGTLMRAGANHPVLVRLGCRFSGEAATCEPRTLVDLGPYPALLPIRPGAPAPPTPVRGEVWEIDADALRELDAFEGCPDLYVRERIALVMRERTAEPEREVEAFTYVLARRPPANARVITTGHYASAGTALPEGAAPEQIEGSTVVLDNRTPTEDGSRPRRRTGRRGPR
jgi:gamma-glutamylaminecyclotransferase